MILYIARQVRHASSVSMPVAFDLKKGHICGLLVELGISGAAAFGEEMEKSSVCFQRKRHNPRQRQVGTFLITPWTKGLG